MDGDARSDRRLFPLTGLQIGDFQCYLSSLTLFLAIESDKFLILVDNQPWLIDKEARPAHFWQLMVTKSRLSPFANTKSRCKSKDNGRTNLRNAAKSKIKKPKKCQWFSLISAMLHHKESLAPMKKLKDSLLLNSDLQRTLYGFIVFEASWDQVRGINYLNELQTDTSLALEAKIMKRWEFDSIIQASDCISSWFAGIPYERCLLQEYLDGVSFKGEVFYDAQNDLRDSSKRSDYEVFIDNSYNGSCNFCLFRDEGANPCETPPTCGSYKRRKIMKSMSVGSDLDGFSDEVYSEIVSSPTYLDSQSSSSSDNETAPMSFEATHYNDVLILFRFSDPDLPFCLRKIIVSDLRLLTLLEYGLPSWVIFLQSYPVFCRIYRPWMCPLARALYVLVSIATVLIGFYDLYKNVPVLRATASRLCGPFFEWVESWEMISRIKYLGTMLFLHNFEKAVAWFLMTTRAIKSLVLVLSKPLSGPVLNLMEFLLPWNTFLEIVEMLSSVIFSVVESASALVLSLVQMLLSPFWFIMSVLWAIATSIVYPVLWLLWEILTIPFHLFAETCNYVLVICSYPYFFVRSTWSSICSVIKLASSTKVTVESYEVSIWRSLWNDLFSQVFRAIRSILYGFIAFFAACNRHRLSIYNCFREFLVNFPYTTARQDPLNSSNMPRPRSPSLPRETRTRGKKCRQHKKKLA